MFENLVNTFPRDVQFLGDPISGYATLAGKGDYMHSKVVYIFFVHLVSLTGMTSTPSSLIVTVHKCRFLPADLDLHAST